jgi:hypothetical protein
MAINARAATMAGQSDNSVPRDSMATYRKAAAAYLAARRGALLRPGAGDAGPLQWSDAWLLHAIKTAQRRGRRAALADIIAAGDFLHHAIFTAEELAGGFRRLHASGFIAIEGAECGVAPPFDAAWKAANAGRKSLRRQYDIICGLLGAPR